MTKEIDKKTSKGFSGKEEASKKKSPAQPGPAQKPLDGAGRVDMTYLEERILAGVEKPVRYVGGELNSRLKEPARLSVSLAFAFPDVYEVGMSHLGSQILYHIVNGEKKYALERVYCPWVDMQEAMRAHQVPLYSLESKRPVADFDFFGFTLQYELSYSNILAMLDLAAIPFYSKDRLAAEEEAEKEEKRVEKEKVVEKERREKEDKGIEEEEREKGKEGEEEAEAGAESLSYPLIIGGGPCAFNPEPLADFFDLFLIGDGEETLVELLRLYEDHKEKGGGYRLRGQAKRAFLKAAASIQGIYVPSFYAASYGEDGTLLDFYPTEEGVPQTVKKSLVKDLNQAPFPDKPVVPYMDIVHDRVMLEVLRGCTHGCRFCQAGIIYRPVRERNKDLLLAQARALVAASGHEDISLTSLSTADHSQLADLVDLLQAEFTDRAVGLSLPSLRVDTFSLGMAKKISSVRKTGLTFAPEAGSQRMRDVINKGVCEEDLMEVAEDAFRAGWQRLKLYFMIGLPFEQDEDLEGIPRLGNKVLFLGKNVAREIGSTRRISVSLSASSFVPKPFTPFQWWGQNDLETLMDKQRYIKDRIRSKNLNFSYHQAHISQLEAAFARGDRRLARVLERAYELGAKFDGWDEFFDHDRWQEAFADCGLSSRAYAGRNFSYEDKLPWDFIDVGVHKSFLYDEYQAAKKTALTPDCRDEGCTGCGICLDWDCQMRIEEE